MESDKPQLQSEKTRLRFEALLRMDRTRLQSESKLHSEKGCRLPQLQSEKSKLHSDKSRLQSGKPSGKPKYKSDNPLVTRQQFRDTRRIVRYV